MTRRSAARIGVNSRDPDHRGGVGDNRLLITDPTQGLRSRGSQVRILPGALSRSTAPGKSGSSCGGTASAWRAAPSGGCLCVVARGMRRPTRTRSSLSAPPTSCGPRLALRGSSCRSSFERTRVSRRLYGRRPVVHQPLNWVRKPIRSSPNSAMVWGALKSVFGCFERIASLPPVPMIYETTSLLRLVSGRGGFDG